MRRTLGVLLAVALIWMPARAGAAKRDGSSEPAPAAAAKRAGSSEPERLMRKSAERWADGTFEQRRKALDALEQAAALAPKDPAVLSKLAHAYLDAGYSHDAKETFERITALAPDDADAWEGLARVWKRDWLATLAPRSRDKSVGYDEQAVRLDPDRAEAWTMLSVLYLERGQPDRSAEAAERALAAAPDSAAPALVGGVSAYQAGRLVQAESLFTLALRRLPPHIAARYRDLSPLLPANDGEALMESAPPVRSEGSRRFWSLNDPDPTTRVNEAQLEYWTRVARASLLYSDSWSPHWDMRAELYVRYGPPEHIAYQPPFVPLAQRSNPVDNLYNDQLEGMRRVGDADPMWYPLHAQVWEYPQLGLAVLLEDRAISQHYELPRRSYAETDVAPDPAAVAASGLNPTAGGRGTFAKLPPGVRPLAVEGSVSVFEGEHGPRLLAHVAAAGSPATALVADCVVLDSTEHEVQRDSRALGASRCDPATTRAGDFAFELPPGAYRVALAVSDGHGGHGVLRAQRDLAPLSATLALSDIVLVCGPLETTPVDGSVRIDPNLERRIGPDEALFAYFEVYRLRPEADGSSRFEYHYVVRALDPDPRPFLQRLFTKGDREPISVHSPAEGAGRVRRQYLRVPTQALKPGHYRLEVTVKDHGATTRREVDFEKVAETNATTLGAR